MDGRGHGAGVQGVDDAKCRTKGAVGNSSFCLFGDHIEDGGSGGFRASTGRCGYGNQWLERLSDGKTFPKWGVDEVEERGIGKAGVEVHELSSVDDAASADGEEGVRLVGFSKVNSFSDSTGL